MPISSFYYYIRAGQIIPSIPCHSRVSRRHQILSPNPLPLFNSSSPATVQKPVNFISHICAFSRGVLNVRSTRSHPTLAPRPQIWLMKFTGFCAVAGEGELNRGEGIGGQKLMSSAYSRMTGNRRYDLPCPYVIVK